MSKRAMLTILAMMLISATGQAQVKIQSGVIIGEVRTVAFGSTSAQVRKELAAAGWAECAGQSLKKTDFPTLAKLLNNAWGSADAANTFYLPDLRGMFLRGWQHASLPGQAPMMGGDANAADRTVPRPQQAAPGVPGASGDAVGSVQQDRAKVEPHTHSEVRETGTKRRADANSEEFMYGPRAVQTGGPEGEATTWETRPKNAYVMFIIYLGRPVSVDDQGRVTVLK
ncbi:MAG TPA: phage tail protein [Thermoanaerobaculia bacterium]